MNVPASDAACATIVKAILSRPIFFFSIFLSFFFVQPTSKVSPDPLARYLPGAYLRMLLISFNLYLPSCVQRCIPSNSPKPVNAGSIRSIPPRCSTPLPPPSTTSSAQPQQQDASICLERLAGAGGTTTYLGMAAHPDGSGRAFLYTQDGKVWLVAVPARGSGAALQVDGGDGAILDLTARALRLTGLALHPEFAANGRLFVSYTCDSDTSPACGRAGTLSSSPPHPPAAGGGNGSGYQLVVEEFTTKGGVDYGMVTYYFVSRIQI